jgi:hypothetical protein
MRAIHWRAHVALVAKHSMSMDSIRGGGDFRVGDVLNRTWQVFTGNIVFFLAIAFLVNVGIALAISLPLGVFGVLVVLVGASTGAWWLIGLGIFLAGLLFIILNTIGEAVVLLGIFQRLRGEPLRVGEALRRAFARSFPLIGVGFLYTLGLFVGFLLLIIPMFFALVIWALAVPACVVEGLGPIASMSRSADLTKGYRWQVLGLILILGVINGIGSQFFALALGLAGEWAAVVGNVIWFVVWTALWNCALIMMYHDLRVAKEGIDTEQIAAIFD